MLATGLGATPLLGACATLGLPPSGVEEVTIAAQAAMQAGRLSAESLVHLYVERILGWGGRILIVGFVGGVQQIPANRLLVKNRAALGCSLRYFRWSAADKLRRSVDELLRWYEAGQLKPCITHRLPLERSVEAIRLLTDRKAHGKVVVVPDLR